MADGNSPSGNTGAGTTETTSSPTPVAPATTGNAPTPTTTTTTAGTPTVQDANSATGGAAGPVAGGELTPDDFKKDGDLRVSAIRDIEERTSPRGAERSFNEVTGKTTVTTQVGGATVTFEQDGDTRAPKRERATDSAIRAFDRQNEEK